MEKQAIDNELKKIEQLYFEDEEANKEACIQQLVALHKKVLNNPSELHHFKTEAAPLCGGIYLPHLFWIELAAFLKDEQNRPAVFSTLEAFTNSSFDEELQNAMKPLLVIYLASEKEFEFNKLKSFVIENAHNLVKEYFEKLVQFVPKNPHAVDAYVHKFRLIGDLFPDFEKFALPLARLQEMA